MKKTIICTSCPMGCEIEVEEVGGKITSIKGNTCPRGAKYAEAEYFHPERVLTTTVKTSNGKWLSVRTQGPIAREKLLEAVRELSKVTVPVPVKIGDIVLENILKTGVDVIATGEVKE